MFSFHIFFIAIVQGITEFLPISSSAHLIMIPYIMKVSDQGVLIDISVHLGSLLALIIFFITDNKKDSISENIRFGIRVPYLDSLLSPILLAVPLQLLAYHVALLKNCDIDKPRNLAKSVTVEWNVY